MTDLSSLLARLENAEGPSRGLDAEISAVLEPHLFDAPGFTPIRPVPAFRYDPTENVIRFEGGGLMDVRFFSPVTSSIDAAVSLAERVLPGWRHAYEKRTNGTCLAWVDIADEEPAFPTIASTPALALVLATLRALDQKRGEV